MGRFNQMLGACAAFGPHRRVGSDCGGQAAAPTPAAQSRAVVPLSLLHHVAQREIALGLLAQVAAVRPETMRFATELETDFRLLDGRILARAEALGIGENRLRQAYADKNTAALDGQADDLDRLAMLRGEDFDRQFWATVARDHSLLRTGSPRRPEPLRPSTLSLPRRFASSIDPFAERSRHKPRQTPRPHADVS